MATALAVELAANCPVLPNYSAGHAHYGLAQNQGQEISAQRARAVSIHLQPCNYGGPRVGSVGASGKIPNQHGDRHGRRAAPRLASSTTCDGPVHSAALSARVCVSRFLLQCFFDAAKERLSTKLY